MKSSLLTLALSLVLACGGDTAEPAPAPAKAPPAAAPAAPAAPAAAPVAAAPAAATKGGGAGDAEAGKEVYTTFCQPCHQADGTGMGGMLAGNFVADKARLAKSDEELLTAIRDGVTGKIGVMPPWKGNLTEEQMVDVLAYIRASYGS